ITGAGFPHSGIHGSKAVQRLTVAYRSRPRPSSTLGAKASTMCPYYLDGDLTELGRARSVIPVATAAYRYAVAVATVQFSRAAERALGRPGRRGGRAGGHRSLKTQQHARPRA